MASHFWAFFGISILVIATPGPDTALTIRNGLLGGRAAGTFTALGVATGQALWALATSAGVVGLLVASEPAFAAVKLAGAGYLVFLGAATLLHAFRANGRLAAPLAGGAARHLATAAAYRQGVVSNLGNPKMAVFFMSLLPQFIPQGQASFGAAALLGLVLCSLTLVWLAGYAVAVARAGDVLRGPRIKRAIESVTGAALIALGVRLAAEER